MAILPLCATAWSPTGVFVEVEKLQVVGLCVHPGEAVDEVRAQAGVHFTNSEETRSWTVDGPTRQKTRQNWKGKSFIAKDAAIEEWNVERVDTKLGAQTEFSQKEEREGNFPLLI